VGTPPEVEPELVEPELEEVVPELVEPELVELEELELELDELDCPPPLLVCPPPKPVPELPPHAIASGSARKRERGRIRRMGLHTSAVRSA
jgi:hypothetical protein